MTAEELRKKIERCLTMIEFTYKGKDGYVDPGYIPETDSHRYDLFYDGTPVSVYTVNDAMRLPFFDGKSLNEIAEELEDIGEF